MNPSPTYAAILLLVFGNLLAALSDVAVKLVGGEVATFQYVFIRQLLSTLVIFPLWWFQPSQPVDFPVAFFCPHVSAQSWPASSSLQWCRLLHLEEFHSGGYKCQIPF